MKTKIIPVACLAVAVVLLFAAYIINNVYKAKDTANATADVSSEANSGSVHFSEIRYDQDSLINDSELIVRCIFTGEKETKKVTALSKNGRGEDMEIKGAITTYKMKTVESLKGSVDDEFEFGLIGTGDRNFKKDSEYVLFLNYNSHNSTYTLVSYSQGFNRVKEISKEEINAAKAAADGTLSQDQTIEIETVETNEVMNYMDLKNKIKELEK